MAPTGFNGNGIKILLTVDERNPGNTGFQTVPPAEDSIPVILTDIISPL